MLIIVPIVIYVAISGMVVITMASDYTTASEKSKRLTGLGNSSGTAI